MRLGDERGGLDVAKREDRRGAPLVDGEGMAAILMTQGRINLGPGEPGPGDEWKFPTGPVAAEPVEPAEAVVAGPEPDRRRPGLVGRFLGRD
jgi:hypothetical protein